MKSKSPFSKKSPMNLQLYRGDTYESPDTVITRTVGEQLGTAITGLADNATKYMDDYKKPEPREKVKTVNAIKGDDRGLVKSRDIGGGGVLSSKTTIDSTPSTSYSQGLSALKENPEKLSTWENKFGKATPGNFKKQTDLYNKKNNSTTAKNKTTEIFGDGRLLKTYSSSVGQMKGSPNKLIGDTMDPYGQPQRGNRDFTFNEKGIAPGTLGNQASMGVQNQIYPGGQAQVAAEQLASQAATSLRADEMDLIGNPDSVLAMKGTPLHTKGHGVEQAHTHPTKTTTKISGKGEMPGSSYVENDYADEDASNAVGLSPHTATLVKTTRKGEPYIREKNAPKFPLSKFENFINENIGKAGAPRRSLSNFPRPDYISNEGDQLDPHNFLFQNTPKK